MFQFPAFPPLARFQEMIPGRFPDLGDLRIKACLAAPRSFSQLSHDLHRLWTPRHPPCTLSSLTTLFLNSYCDWPLHSQFTLFSKNPSAFTEGVSSQRPLWFDTGAPRSWWRRPDSNRRPPGCKPGALPTELRPRSGATGRRGRLGSSSSAGWWA